MTQTDPTAVIHDALAGLQGGPHHMPPGTRKAIAEHLAATLPASAVVPPPTSRAAVLLDVAAECNKAGGAYVERGANAAAGAAFALMETFLRKAGEAEYEATPCSVPNVCEDGGEPCEVHERILGHIDGYHDLCAPDCGQEWQRRLAVEAHGTETQQQDEVRPVRGDQFEAWLKAQRDEHGWQGSNDRRLYDAFDNALDLYRLHADTGTPLSEHVCEGRVAGDCECLEPAPVAEQPVAADDEETGRG